MECIPAIDIRGGRSVRLLRGEFDAETVFGDPVAQAEDYVRRGARRLHLVDLDAARSGEPVNEAVVARILGQTGVAVEVGGGVRSAPRVETLLAQGAARVVLGTVAIEEPELLARLVAAHPGRIAVGLDHRRVERAGGVTREVALRGWEVGSGLGLSEAVQRLVGLDLAALIVTDISKDGTLEGPDLDGYALLLKETAQPIIASGGVGRPAHLRALRSLDVGGRGLAGVIVGRAIVSGAIGLEEAMRACGP